MKKIEEKYTLLLSKVLLRTENEIREYLKEMDPADLAILGFDSQTIAEQKISDIVCKISMAELQNQSASSTLASLIYDICVETKDKDNYNAHHYAEVYSTVMSDKSLKPFLAREKVLSQVLKNSTIFYAVDIVCHYDGIKNSKYMSEEKKVLFLDELIIEEDKKASSSKAKKQVIRTKK